MPGDHPHGTRETQGPPGHQPAPGGTPRGEKPPIEATGATGARRPTDPVDLKKRKSIIRRFAILIAGSVVILVGIAIGILPGPGPVILVPVGLAILATEFEWARRLLYRFKSGAADLATETDRLTGFVSRIWIFPVIAVYWFLVWQAYRRFPEHPQKVLIVGFSTFIPVAYACYRVAVIRARKKTLRRLYERVRARLSARRSAR